MVGVVLGWVGWVGWIGLGRLGLLGWGCFGLGWLVGVVGWGCFGLGWVDWIGLGWVGWVGWGCFGLGWLDWLVGVGWVGWLGRLDWFGSVGLVGVVLGWVGSVAPLKAASLTPRANIPLFKPAIRQKLPPLQQRAEGTPKHRAAPRTSRGSGAPPHRGLWGGPHISRGAQQTPSLPPAHPGPHSAGSAPGRAGPPPPNLRAHTNN